MKFPCILFATGIYIAAFAVVDNVAAQVKGYENLDEFLTEVKTTANSFLDYVTKMQALFCPNQPVCGADGELEKKDVLGTLPGMISLGDITVNVGDIVDSVDICCMPCSCTDSCWKVNNCCATKQLYPDTSKNSTAVEQECIAASVMSYRNKLTLDTSQANNMFHMVTSCFLDNSNPTLVAECQHPDPDALSNNIPVTSQKTGNTYWNEPCAICNDDDDDIIEWTPNVIIKPSIAYFYKTSSLWSMPYPDTYESLSKLLNARRRSDIFYIPPESITPKNHKCMREELLKLPDCKQTLDEEGSSTPDWLVESCRHIFSPVQYGIRDLFYKNIFCVACDSLLQLVTNKQICGAEEPDRTSPGYLTALFNYKLEPDQPAPLEVDEEKCDCTKMFDPYLNLCRPLYCSSGEIQAGCHCIQPFRQLSGMPVAIMVKVTSRQDGPDSLTGGQLGKLHTALEKALEAIAVNTTAEVAITLQQENATSLTYLSIVIAYSDRGTDTKVAMRPFLKYLDVDEVLEVTIDKLDLLATLTTNATLWIEWEDSRETFKACCLDQQPNQVVQVYVSKDVMNFGNIGHGVYQPMSRLLYCKQVELNQTEHCITDSGILYINATKPVIAIWDYHPVSASRVRVCADMYIPKTYRKGKGSIGALCTCSVEVMVISLMSVVATYFLSSLFTFKFVFLVAVLLVVNGLFYVYTSRTYTVVPSVTVSRLSQMTKLVKSARLLFCCVSGGCGAVIAWVCTCMLGARYAGLSYRCAENSDLYCINEYHLFLVLYGIYSGVMYVFYHYYKQVNYLQFPPLQEAKFFQVRGKVLDVFYSSVGHVLWQIKFFYILYFFTGGIPRSWIADTLSLRYGSEYRLDSLYGLLFDFRLLWQTLLSGLFLQFTWSYGALLYKVYNTEVSVYRTIGPLVLFQHFEFPIVSMFDNFKNKCLVDALSCRNMPLVQSLGFYDLNILSKYSFTRRRELFSLSQPGGHPHNWNKIVAVCLSTVNELSDQIQDTNWKILASAPVRQQNGDKHVAHNISTVGNGHALDTSKTQTQLQPEVTFQNKIFGAIKKLPVLNSLSTTEVPENKNKNLFLSCQIQVWAVEALSCLVEASYTEDNYGVVQMSLANIITAILSLQENVEKHFKLTGGVTRRSQKDPPANDITLKYLLQTTIKASIYRIVNTFGKHLMELQLPVETEKKTRHFIDFRE